VVVFFEKQKSKKRHLKAPEQNFYILAKNRRAFKINPTNQKF